MLQHLQSPAASLNASRCVKRIHASNKQAESVRFLGFELWTFQLEGLTFY